MDHENPKNDLKTLGPSRKEIDLVVPEKDVQKELDIAAKNYASQVRIPGFRAGKAPVEHVRRLYAEDIRHSAVESLIPRFLEQELKTRGMEPVGTPLIEELDFPESGMLRARVSFEVIPDFDLPDYRAIQIEGKGEEEVRDEDVLKAVEDLRNQAADYVPVEARGVQDGDYVVIEMQGKDLKSRKLLPVEKAVVLAGHSGNEPFLNEHLPGIPPGGERILTTTYDETHPNRKLAGRDVEYRLRVSEIKEKKLPELDDEFAKRLGAYENLDALKSDIRDRLQAARKDSVKKETAAEVVKTVTESVALEPPESLVEHEMAVVLRRLAASLPRGGSLTAETADILKTEARNQARRNIKNRIVLHEIAKREGFHVTPEDIREEIAALAGVEGVQPDALYEDLQERGRLEAVRENLLIRKTVDFLVGNAIIK
jgi:trigger factor